MDTTPSPATNKKVIRVDTRYRHRAQDLSSEEKRLAQQRKAQQKLQQEEAIEKKKADQTERPHNDRGEPLLIREQNGRAVMGRAHRMFHRRAAQEAPAVLTVNVNVIETVDTNGNVIAQQTLPPGVPPPMPTVAPPAVPSVPAFPSDLTVPAYPWPSGVPSVIEAAAPTSPAADTAPPALTTPAPVTPLFPSNSTISSTVLSSSLSSISLSSISSSSSSFSSSASLSSLSLSSSRGSSSASPTTSSNARVATSSAYGGGGGGGVANTATSPEATGAAAAAGDSESKGPLDTPGVVGSVVGSLAGAALILAIILMLIKRHKRKQRGGALQLQDDASERDQVMSQPQSNVRNSLVPAYFLHRFSGVSRASRASRSTADTSTTGGERGFQRISGRKLPSAFSEGMTSEQFAASRGEGTLSGSSFYRDEKGFYGGPGYSKEFSKEIGESSMPQNVPSQERFMPSPARTPVIRHPDDTAPFALSPPQTPNPEYPPRGTLGRSHPSHDGSRSSRFTENV